MLVLRFPTITHFKVRALEWVIAIIMLNWAVVLAQPTDTFANQKSLWMLANTFSEQTWVYICAAIAGVRLMALYRNGAWTPSPALRMFTAFLSSIFWLYISLGMALTDFASTGLTVYPVLYFCDLYSMWRAGQDLLSSKEARNRKPEAPLIIAS